MYLERNCRWVALRSVCDGGTGCVSCVGCGDCGGWEGYGGYVLIWGLSGCAGFAGCFATNNYAWALKFRCCGECTQPEPQYFLESAMIKKWPGIALVLVPE